MSEVQTASVGRMAGAAIACCAAIATFATAISSAVSTGDTAEAQTVPYILGIAHPTGFPAYTLLGWAFSHAVAIGTVAWRMNAFTALCVALTAGGVVLCATALNCSVYAALAAALLFAFGSIVRSEAVLASPQGLAGACAFGALAASVWYARTGDRRTLVAACGLAGLGLATHPVAMFVLPGIAVAAAWQRSKLTLRTVALAVAVLLAPLVLYLYLPVRSAVVAARHLDPVAAGPLYGAGSIDWDTNAPRTLDGFLNEVLARHEYAGSSLANAARPQVIPRTFRLWAAFAGRQYPVWLQFIALAGILALVQRDLRALSVLVAGTAGGLLFAGQYSGDTTVYWYLFVPFAVAAALMAAATRLLLPRMPRTIVPAGASAALVIAALIAWSNPRSDLGIPVPPNGQPIIDAVARDVPDGSIVVASWYEASALGYGAAVEHALGSRTIVAGWPGQFASRFPDWTRTRRVVVYASGLELLSISAIPAAWLDELPSSLLIYRAFEIRPRPE